MRGEGFTDRRVAIRPIETGRFILGSWLFWLEGWLLEYRLWRFEVLLHQGRGSRSEGTWVEGFG